MFKYFIKIYVFTKIIGIIKEVTDGPLYTNKYGNDDPQFIDTAYRVIADHARTMIFAINDGVIPGATERNYVVRRLIRRAVRYGTKLGSKDGFLSLIVRKVIIFLTSEYPELEGNADKITNIIQDEEIKFSRVMRKGLRLFNKVIQDNKSNVPMEKLLDLYITFGFPVDIIKQLCEENNIIFNVDEYNNLMDDHVQKSKNKKFKQP